MTHFTYYLSKMKKSDVVHHLSKAMDEFLRTRIGACRRSVLFPLGVLLFYWKVSSMYARVDVPFDWENIRNTRSTNYSLLLHILYRSLHILRRSGRPTIASCV